MAELPSGTVTFLFTDVEGSTRLLKQLGPEYAELLSEHHRILRAAFAAHGGSEVDNQGDSFFVAFQTAKDAVAAAVDAQRDLFAQAWPEGARSGCGWGCTRVSRGAATIVMSGSVCIVRRGSGRPGTAARCCCRRRRRSWPRRTCPRASRSIDLGERRLKDLDQPQRAVPAGDRGFAGRVRAAEDTRCRAAAQAAADVCGCGVDRRCCGCGCDSGVRVGAGRLGRVDGGERERGRDHRPRLEQGQRPGAGRRRAGGARRRCGRPLGREHAATRRVTHIDLASGKFVGNVPLAGDVPLSLAATPNAVWVVGQAARRRRRCWSRSTRTSIPPGRRGSCPASPMAAMGVAVGRGDVWVVSEGGQLDRFDSAGKQVGAPIDTDNEPVQCRGRRGRDLGRRHVRQHRRPDRPDDEARQPPPRSATTRPRSRSGRARSGWRTSSTTRSSASTRPRTRSRRRSRSGSAPAGIAVGLGSVWVANSVDGTVSRIDPRTNTVVKTITVGGSPQAIAVGGGKVWVSVQNALVDPGKQAGAGCARRPTRATVDSLDPAARRTTAAPGRSSMRPARSCSTTPTGRTGRDTARAGGRQGDPRPHRRRQDLHLHDQARLPLLPTVERPGHRPRRSSSRSSGRLSQDDVQQRPTPTTLATSSAPRPTRPARRSTSPVSARTATR